MRAGVDDQAGAAAILSAPIGSTVHDKATVSGALTPPTGTVDFTVYTDAVNCTGASVGADGDPLLRVLRIRRLMRLLV